MRTLTLLIFTATSSFILAQVPSPFIHIDQFGYLTESEKVAVLSNPQVGYNSSMAYSPSNQLEIIDATTNVSALSISPQSWNGGSQHNQSGDQGWWLDFSSLTTPGEYYIEDVANNQRSATFSIGNFPYNEIIKAAGRTFFYNRCNLEKATPYAEAAWSDANNFSNPLQDANCRYIYDASNTALEKELSGGWFDAGDYNKYVTFAHSAIHNLLAAYEENPQAFGDDWNIPESGNNIPDILDEIKWELDWLLKMNNADGSTIIKMGSQNYQDNTEAPPSLCVDQRFYGPTCTSASIAVASMFAHAAKIFQQFPSLQIYTDTLSNRAIKSWGYVQPFIISNQLETNCDDGSIISGDADWDSETQMENAVLAAMHLYDLTGDNAHHDFFVTHYESTAPIESDYWDGYRMALNDGLLRYTVIAGANSGVVSDIQNSITTAVNNNWNGFFGFNSDDLYRAFVPDWAYHWGSNMPKANFANLNNLLLEYNINSGQQAAFNKYINENLHYFHGVNPQGLVYMSNMSQYGAERSCDEIYHTWFADGSDWDNANTSLYGPAPGFVPGGPNHSFSVPSLSPPSGQPDQKSYLDFNTNFPQNSWEITEPAIYYQAAYIRLLANAVDVTATSGAGNLYASPIDIDIYPNPSNQYFIIRGNLADYNIDLLDANGQMVHNLNSMSNELTVDTSTLGSGLYFVRVQHTDPTKEKLMVQKIIKLN